MAGKLLLSHGVSHGEQLLNSSVVYSLVWQRGGCEPYHQASTASEYKQASRGCGDVNQRPPRPLPLVFASLQISPALCSSAAFSAKLTLRLHRSLTLITNTWAENWSTLAGGAHLHFLKPRWRTSVRSQCQDVSVQEKTFHPTEADKGPVW